MFSIWIEPHERHEAVQVYRDRLTAEQVDEIEDAPESALVRLNINVGAPTEVLIVPEG